MCSKCAFQSLRLLRLLYSSLKSYENICTIDYFEAYIFKKQNKQKPLRAWLAQLWDPRKCFSPALTSVRCLELSFHPHAPFRICPCQSPASKPSLSPHHLQEEAPATEQDTQPSGLGHPTLHSHHACSMFSLEQIAFCYWMHYILAFLSAFCIPLLIDCSPLGKSFG